MKAKVQVPSPVLFQEVEVEGTPDEIAEFVKALGKDAPGPLPFGRVATIPTVWTQPDVCPQDGGAHQYPTLWMSVSPPSCEKCHQIADSWIQPTWTLSLVGQRDIQATAIETPIEGQYFWRGEGP